MLSDPVLVFGVGEGFVAGANAVAGEEAAKAVDGSGAGLFGFEMQVEELPFFKGGLVGLPDGFGLALEVDAGDADGGEFVVIDVFVGLCSDPGTFEDGAVEPLFGEPAAEFKAAVAGFDEDDVFG